MRFTQLRKELRKQYTSNTKRELDYIKENYTTFIELEKKVTKYYYKKSLNVQYKKAGANTEKQKTQVLYTLIKAYYNSYYEKEMAKLEELENTDTTNISNSFNIVVDWVKNSTWGNNPHASIFYKGRYYEGRASGCGYDKRNAATGEALNQIKEIRALICQVKEKALRKGANNSNRDILGYGSGYGVIPYFEGGVGFGCHRDILNKIGFTCLLYDESRKSQDVYIFDRKGKR